MSDEALNTAQEAVAAEQDNQLLTVWLDGQLYGAAIDHVDQIISMQPISSVPEFPPYAKGIINLRGSIIPVIDLRLRLGKQETAYTERTCIVNILVGNQQLGCIVDAVDAVVHVTDDQILPPPQMSEKTSANRYLTGIAQLSTESGGAEKVVLCLDLTKLLLQDEFSALNDAVEN